MNLTTPTAKEQQGFTLIEALIAFVIVAIGLLAVASFQSGLFTESAYSKARTEALALAQEKIEQFKHYTLSDKDNFIDENGDGIMDPDGDYDDAVIPGQNAEFTRGWTIVTNGAIKTINVTVAWTDRTGESQEVRLTSDIAWVSPRVGADLVSGLSDPLIPSTTGRAKLGEGEISQYPDATLRSDNSADGMDVYQNDDNLLLVDAAGRVVLTLLDACATGTCTDFVRISGTIYIDTRNTNQAATDLFVLASDAAFCQRWVDSGTLQNPPTTASGHYKYFNYTCYLGGGWHGNIGFVTASGVSQRDKVCQGDPTSANAWEQPVIALRRAYRGMTHLLSNQSRYFSVGIADATQFTGHDFVFTELTPGSTAGTNCTGANGPMTRGDAAGGTLFAGTPTDFFCLNTDTNGDGSPDYLDTFDTSLYGANTTCPYDPTDPPVAEHHITGTITVTASIDLDLDDFTVVTSDGPGNCSWTSPFSSTNTGYSAAYSCNVYDWGNGWTGTVQAQPNSNAVACVNGTASFSGVTADQTRNFSCVQGSIITIRGSLTKNNGANITSITMRNTDTSEAGTCTFSTVDYSCVSAPFTTSGWNGRITVTSSKPVCNATTAGVINFTNITSAQSPYTYNITSGNSCP